MWKYNSDFYHNIYSDDATLILLLNKSLCQKISIFCFEVESRLGTDHIGKNSDSLFLDMQSNSGIMLMI